MDILLIKEALMLVGPDRGLEFELGGMKLGGRTPFMSLRWRKSSAWTVDCKDCDDCDDCDDRPPFGESSGIACRWAAAAIFFSWCCGSSTVAVHWLKK
tara:strand:+ start:163 stop:456 length:294 start_codon:yes stop_codon:yes gene_type:complete